MKRILKSMCKKSFLGEESMGENMWVKRICKKSIWVKSLWVQSMCKKSFWVKSLGEKYMVNSMCKSSFWVKNFRVKSSG